MVFVFVFDLIQGTYVREFRKIKKKVLVSTLNEQVTTRRNDLTDKGLPNLT